MKKRLLVLSVDAMVCEDIDYLSTKPNFQKYFGRASRAEGIRTIYPSVTYPAHVSILTGCYPDKHGVYSNCAFTTKDKNDTWQWFHDAVKADDVITAAKRAGYSTAAVSWPVTGCHKDVDYLIDEYWMPLPGDTLLESYRRAGSSDVVLEIIDHRKNLLHPDYEKGGRKILMSEPYIDNFIIACSCDIIRRFTPEVFFVHIGNMDGIRHKTGVFSPQIPVELDRVDAYLGQLMEALESKGLLEETNLVLLSDHGQMDLVRTVKPNVYLADGGFLTVGSDGKPTDDWQAYSFSNAMSALVYLRDPTDRDLHDRVYAYLDGLAREGVYGFDKVYTREEVRERDHLDGDFSFILETDGYTSFSDSCTRPILQPLDVNDYRFGHASHGYYPDKGPQAVFVAAGPDFREGVNVGRREIVDEAPTLARLLGVDLPGADGAVIDGLLKE